MGVISRRKNSTKFENAKEAIRRVGDADAPSAREVKKSVDTVFAYLEGKEGKGRASATPGARSSGGGIRRKGAFVILCFATDEKASSFDEVFSMAPHLSGRMRRNEDASLKKE